MPLFLALLTLSAARPLSAQITVNPAALADFDTQSAGLNERIAADKKERRKPRPEPKLPENFLPVPLTPQATNYSCGPAALLSILKYWQAYDGDESGLHAQLETTPDDGTEPKKLLEAAKKLGLKAEMKQNLKPADLRTALNNGDTAILNIQAWRNDEEKKTPWRKTWEKGHYVVLLGMDKHYAYFMDPLIDNGYGYIPLKELGKRWHDYEDRTGTREEHYRLAVIISGNGKKPLTTRPKVGIERLE